jgi:gentisate 1,2-dioxygenase
MDHVPAETPERKAFYTRIDKQNMTALWTVMNALITPEPKSQCVPAVWHFDGECVLFSFSDRVVQEKLGIWRERRGNA